jgi:hypothetical protein
MRTRGDFPVLFAPLVIVVCFLSSYALPYLIADPAQFGIYRPRYHWLYAHVVSGSLALLLGPVQIWLGMNRLHKVIHRMLGIAYVVAVSAGATTAFYLAWRTDFGWVFGLGFATMAFAWIGCTAMAMLAISWHCIEQHREWVTRSYVLTSAFVTFRMIDSILEMMNAGNILERKAAATWLALTVPLLITEFVIQGRKILAKPINEAQPLDANADTVAPKPVPFGLPDSGSPYLRQP